MGKLTEANVSEKLFLFTSPFLAAIGTAAGIFFPSLGVSVVLFALAASALTIGSAVTLAVFGLAVFLMALYFFYKLSVHIYSTFDKIKSKQETLQNLLIECLAISKIIEQIEKIYPSGATISVPSLLVKDSSQKAILLAEMTNRLKKLLGTDTQEEKKLDKPLVEAFKTHLLNDFLSEGNELKKVYEAFEKAIFLKPSRNTSLVNSPALSAGVGFLIAFSSIFGSSVGLMSTVGNIGVAVGAVGGLFAIAPPILITVIVVSLIVSIAAAFFVYSYEKRHAKRKQFLKALDKEIETLKEKKTTLSQFFENKKSFEENKSQEKSISSLPFFSSFWNPIAENLILPVGLQSPANNPRMTKTG